MIDLNLQKVWYAETPVLQNFSLRVARSETVAIIGESGIGKSTVLKMIAGLHTRYEGSVTVEQGAKISLMPQGKCLLPWRTVEQNVAALVPKVDEKKLAELLANLGIAEYASRFPLNLSGGQYQRAALGQALFCEPDILLMDEPFSALDPATKQGMLDLFRRLRNERKMTTVFVTHNVSEAEYLCARVVRLEDGEAGEWV